MQRALLGLIAFCFLLSSGVLWFFMPEFNGRMELGAAALRLGIILFVIWLALPNFLGLFQRFPPWLVGSTLLVLLMIVLRPKTAIFLFPILVALWALGPQWFGKQSK